MGTEGQLDLFADTPKTGCPECGGTITIVDRVGPVGRCRECEAFVITNERGGWQEFRSYFDTTGWRAKSAKGKSTRKPKTGTRQ